MFQITIDEQKVDITELIGFIKGFLRNPKTAKVPPFVRAKMIEDAEYWNVNVKGATVTLIPLSDFSEIIAKSMNNEHFKGTWTGRNLELELI